MMGWEKSSLLQEESSVKMTWIPLVIEGTSIMTMIAMTIAMTTAMTMEDLVIHCHGENYLTMDERKGQVSQSMIELYLDGRLEAQKGLILILVVGQCQRSQACLFDFLCKYYKDAMKVNK